MGGATGLEPATSGLTDRALRGRVLPSARGAAAAAAARALRRGRRGWSARGRGRALGAGAGLDDRLTVGDVGREGDGIPAVGDEGPGRLVVLRAQALEGLEEGLEGVLAGLGKGRADADHLPAGGEGDGAQVGAVSLVDHRGLD